MFDDITINDLLDKQHYNISTRIGNWTHEGSGWEFDLMVLHQLGISEIAPCEGSSYFSLPKELNSSMKGLINIQNKDNECFRSCLVRNLNTMEKNPLAILLTLLQQ